MAAEATALVLDGPGQMAPRTFRIPTIGDDDALLEVEACGLCGTDHELYTGALPWPPGFVPGHETVGTLVEIGAEASRRWGVHAGQRVAVATRQACRTCDRCQQGDLTVCRKYGRPGESYGMVSAAIEPSLWGGYSTHHYLAPDSVVHAVPDGIDAVDATLFNPLGAGIAWGVDLPETKPGERVAILGPGIRGIAAVAAVKAAGAGFVMVTGAGERDRGRLDAARQLGADLVVDVTHEDPVKAFESACGGLADVVVDVTANAPSAFPQAIALAARFGRVVIAGIRGGEITVSLQPDLIPSRSLRILGASGVSTGAQRRALELIGSGQVAIDALTRRTAGFDDLGELLLLMAGEGPAEPPLHGAFVPHIA